MTPPPVVPMVMLPPVITAAPVAGAGTQSSAGATPQPGPGTGAGGEGTGLGSGDLGDDTGDGADGGTWAEWKSGRIRDRDYPAAAFQSGIQGVLRTRYTIGTNGRVIRCEVLDSSGSPLLDETTCRLVMQRFRYRPARNAAGKPVVDVIMQRHHWELDSPGVKPPATPPESFTNPPRDPLSPP